MPSYRLLLTAALCALPALAAEHVVLQNGFRIEADRHEESGTLVRVHTSTGVLEIPRETVAAYEPVEAVARPAAPAPVTPPTTPAAVTAQAAPEIKRTQSPRELVLEAAARHGLPPEFVAAVAAQESGFRTDALSPKGAIGVMQLMPGTAAQLGANPHDPQQNIEAGTRLLKELLLKYQHHDNQVLLALAAYNAGEGAVARYKGVPPYRETRNYVSRIVRKYQGQQAK